MAEIDIIALYDRAAVVQKAEGVPLADQEATETTYRAHDSACIHGIAEGLDELAATLDRLVSAAERRLRIQLPEA